MECADEATSSGIMLGQHAEISKLDIELYEM